jgi:hypothetical protein
MDLNNWISVGYELPKDRPGFSHSENVIICYADGEVAFGAYRYLNIKEWSDMIYGERNVPITHWQPLPSPPKNTTEGLT